MDSLRQIAAFVGMEHAGDMRGVPNFVPVLSESERTSMRAMIKALQGLPPISLEAEAAALSGEVPFLTTVTVHPSAGVIHSTTVITSQNGRIVGGPIALSNQLQNTSFDAVTPGQYVFDVSRVGVTSSGITTLDKVILFNALPHIAPPPQLVPPTINASNSGGSGDIGIFAVSGSGFSPNHPVAIRVADDTLHDNRFEIDINGQAIRSDSQGKLTNVKI